MGISQFIKDRFSRGACCGQFNEAILQECQSACLRPGKNIHKYILIFEAKTPPIFFLGNQDDEEIGVLDSVLMRKKDDLGRPLPSRTRKSKLSFSTTKTMTFTSRNESDISSFLVEYHSGLLKRTCFEVRRWENLDLLGKIHFIKKTALVESPIMSAEIQIHTKGFSYPDIALIEKKGDWHGYFSEISQDSKKIIVKVRL